MGKEEQGKALIVANSAENLMTYNQILDDKFITKNSPTYDSTLDLLDDFEPDVVIIDEEIKNSAAIDIAEAIRTDSVTHGYTGIVIVADPKNLELEDLKKDSHADFVIARSDVETYLTMTSEEALSKKLITNRNNGLIRKLGDTKDAIRLLEDQDSIARVYNLPYINALSEKEFERTLRFNAPMSIIIISIDSFINISHTEGPKFCIKIIQQLGEVLNTEFREDDILGRSWGGEFVGILPDTDHKGSIILAKRIKTVVAEQLFGIIGNEIPITLSQGIGCYNPYDTKKTEVTEVLLEAESNLSEAKKMGLNLIYHNKCTA